MRRLMIVQDTGGAIRGAQRADNLSASGDAEGEARARSAIRVGWSYTPCPIELAHQRVPDA